MRLAWIGGGTTNPCHRLELQRRVERHGHAAWTVGTMRGMDWVIVNSGCGHDGESPRGAGSLVSIAGAKLYKKPGTWTVWSQGRRTQEDPIYAAIPSPP